MIEKWIAELRALYRESKRNMRTLLAILLSLVFVAPSGAQTRDLRVGLTLDTVLAPGTTHDYHLQLRGQESFK